MFKMDGLDVEVINSLKVDQEVVKDKVYCVCVKNIIILLFNDLVKVIFLI